MRAPIRLAVAALALAAAAPAPSVTVATPWFRMITPQTPAGGYMTVHNISNHTVTLTGATSPGCGTLMLHRTEGDRMVMIKQAPIPAGGTLALAQGGYHLMCMSPRMTVGGSVPVTLHFLDGASLEASFPVIGAKDHPPRSGD